jgi:uncharacterized membrane protein YjfL (UPF0719 family)
MSIDNILTGLVFLIVVFVLFFIAQLFYDKTRPRFDLKVELVKKDNAALALAVGGYYLGLMIAMGGVLEGESEGIVIDLIDIVLYGLLAIFLLNLSVWINDKLILHHFDNMKEIIDDQNPGTGIVEAGNHIAVGMVMYGAMSGEGDVITGAVFWILGQIVLILSGLIYVRMLPFDLHAEIEKDNFAVGIAFAGVLVAIGNLIRIGASGDFISWNTNMTTFWSFVVLGLVMLPIVRWMADKLLLPGENLSDELVRQETPNVGAGLIEALSYIGGSFILGWVF